MILDHQKREPTHNVPHPRTLRKAREQVKQMVIDGTSSRRIRNYLNRWITWWVNTSETWQYLELLYQFIDVCRDKRVIDYATALYQLHFNKLRTETIPFVDVAI